MYQIWVLTAKKKAAHEKSQPRVDWLLRIGKLNLRQKCDGMDCVVRARLSTQTRTHNKRSNRC